MIRRPNESDIGKLRELHSKFFAGEFGFDDFVTNSLYNFVVANATSDPDGEIITAGSIRPIAEIVAITDMSKSPRIRRSALFEMLQVAHFVLRETPMRQLHAFVQDKIWEQQLIKVGFQRTKGNALYINL